MDPGDSPPARAREAANDPLHALPYEEQLARLRTLAEAAARRYALGPVDLTLLQYENNAVFRVTGRAHHRFVLRIGTAGGRTAAEQRSEAVWLSALRRDAGARVPEPVANVDGELVTGLAVPGSRDPEPHPAVLFRWVPGDPPSPGMGAPAMERIGAFTAGLHRHAEGFVPPAGFTRPRWDWEHLFGPSSVLAREAIVGALDPRLREVVTAAGRSVRDALDGSGGTEPERGLIHADLHRDNLLLHDGAVGAIDFDDCGWGYFMFDLATVLDSFRRRVARDPGEFARLRDACLRGYERVRALPAEVDAQLGTFGAMRDMVNLGFILGSRNPNVREWGGGRVELFVAQLQSWLNGASPLVHAGRRGGR